MALLIWSLYKLLKVEIIIKIIKSRNKLLLYMYCPLIIFTGQIQMTYYHWYSSRLCAQESKSDKNSLGTSMMSRRSSSISIAICSISGGTLSWMGYGVGLLVSEYGAVSIDAQLLVVIGYKFFRPYWVIKVSCRESSSSLLESISGWGVSSKVRCLWAPW